MVIAGFRVHKLLIFVHTGFSIYFFFFLRTRLSNFQLSIRTFFQSRLGIIRRCMSEGLLL